MKKIILPLMLVVVMLIGCITTSKVMSPREFGQVLICNFTPHGTNYVLIDNSYKPDGENGFVVAAGGLFPGQTHLVQGYEGTFTVWQQFPYDPGANDSRWEVKFIKGDWIMEDGSFAAQRVFLKSPEEWKDENETESDVPEQFEQDAPEEEESFGDPIPGGTLRS
jgi:hypothetical protein